MTDELPTWILRGLARDTAREVDEVDFDAFRRELDERLDAESRIIPFAERRFTRDLGRELDALEPRFQGEFLSALEERLPARKSRSRLIAGLSAAAAAIAFAFTGLAERPASAGEIAVERVTFEGTVTVIQEDGVALIWLADPEAAAE